MSPNDRKQILITASVIALGFILAYSSILLLGSLRWLIEPLVVAVFLWFAGDGAVTWLVERGWRRSWAAGTVLLSIVVMLGVAIGVLIPSVVSTVSLLMDNMDQVSSDIGGFSQHFGMNAHQVNVAIRDGLELLKSNASHTVLSVSALHSAALAIAQVMTAMFLLYYLLAEGPKIRRGLIRILPRTRRVMTDRIWDLSLEKVAGFLYGNILLALIAGFFTAAVAALLSVPAAAGLGAWVVLASMVPLVGGWLAALLPVATTLAYDLARGQGLTRTVIMVLALLAFQALDNYLLRPRVLSHTVDVHPAVAFLAVAAGASMGGLVGAILAIPVTAVAYALLSEHMALASTEDNVAAD